MTQNERQKGFSLIELIVVLTIFMVILGTAVALLISTITQQRRILAKQELINQTSYVAEYISKPLRMAIKDPDGTCLGVAGYVYVLTHCNAGVCSGVKFINSLSNNACDEFFLDTTTNPASPTLSEVKNGSMKNNILSDKFTIKYAKFFLDGNGAKVIASDQDTIQPRVTMVFDVQTQAQSGAQEEVLQTTVSQRNLIK